MCNAVVDLPEPPFSLPSTTTCADCGVSWIDWINMEAPFDPAILKVLLHFSQVWSNLIINPAVAVSALLC
jgi:hypothetical protein